MFEYRDFHGKDKMTERETAWLFQRLAPDHYRSCIFMIENYYPVGEIITAQNRTSEYYTIARLALLNVLENTNV